MTTAFVHRRCSLRVGTLPRVCRWRPRRLGYDVAVGLTGAGDATTILTSRPESRGEAVATYVLRVVEGQDAGSSLIVDGNRPGRVLVGEGLACELRLNDPEVSRRHCACEATPNGLRVTDLGSTNGTWQGRTQLLDAYLSGGETLRIGATTIAVDLAGGPQPRTAVSTAASRTRTDSPADRRTRSTTARTGGRRARRLVRTDASSHPSDRTTGATRLRRTPVPWPRAAPRTTLPRRTPMPARARARTPARERRTTQAPAAPSAPKAAAIRVTATAAPTVHPRVARPVRAAAAARARVNRRTRRRCSSRLAPSSRRGAAAAAAREAR